PGIEVQAVNKVFKDRVLKATSDKKGNFTVSGLLYGATAKDWTVSIKGPGFVPVSAHVVGRGSDGTLYLEDSEPLDAKRSSFDVMVNAFASIRIEFKMRPGDAAAEAAPPAAEGNAALGAAGVAALPPPGDSYGDAVAKVRAGDAEGSVDLFK